MRRVRAGALARTLRPGDRAVSPFRGHGDTAPAGVLAVPAYPDGMSTSMTRRPARRPARTGGALQPGLPVVTVLALMWVSEGVDAIVPADLDQLGIRPRSLEGLLGIPLAPFLHGSWAHLIANSGAFLVLGLTVALTTRRFWPASILVTLISGLGVWLLAAPNTVTVGASGLVYGYAAFLVGWGLFTRRIASIVVAVLVIAVYGSLVWGVLPGNAYVSWQGHLFGAVGGVVAAWLLSRSRTPARVLH